MGIQGRKKYIFLLLTGVFAAYVGQHIYGNIFNNYLEDVHKISPEARGLLEFPRELPGILALFAVSAFFFLRENLIGALASLLLCAGVSLLAVPFLSSSFTSLIVLIMIASLGQHVLMVIIDAIVIHSVAPENRSLRLGQMRALMTAAGLVGAFYVWMKWKVNTSFSIDFIVAGAMCFIGSLFFAMLNTKSFPQHKSWKERFVFRRNYLKYYILEAFFGARKQVFITFGFWVMVDTLGKSPSFIGKIMLTAGVLGIFVKPFVGKIIQKYGERKVLVTDSILLIMVCLGYAFSLEIFSFNSAVAVISMCFIFDNLLFAVSTARSSYIARKAEKKEDITPTLYTGMAINHVTSITGAMVGGFIWKYTGTHIWVFIFAACLALFSGSVAATIKD